MKDKNEIKSLSHSKYRCQYHIVFAPKYRRKENIWKNQKRYRRDIEEIVHAKRRGNNRGRSMCRPHTYVGEHTSIFKYSTIHGISQRKK